MAYIKAYSDENKRHPDLFKLKVASDELVVERIRALCDAFGLPHIDVVFIKRAGGGHYSPSRKHLAFSKAEKKGATWLLVAHEFAHYLTDKERKEKIKALQRQIDGCAAAVRVIPTPSIAYCEAKFEQKKKLIEKRDDLQNRGAHTRDFAKNVDKACEYIRKQGWQVGSEECPVAAKNKVDAPPEGAVTYDVVARTLQLMPDLLLCPKCRQTKAKEEFGVRVMSRYADGTPAHARRQSYCRPCRSAK